MNKSLFTGTFNANSTTTHQPQRRVIDDVTRMYHWLFAVSFIGAYITADSDAWLTLHMGLGYLMIGLLAFRVAWGLLGPKRARLGSLMSRSAGMRAWIANHKDRRDIWRFNWQTPQNTVIALIVALVLVSTIPLVLSGYLTHAEMLGGLMDDVHEALAELYLALVIAHLAAIATISLWRRHHLSRPMFTGFTAGKGPDLVTRTHTWLGALMLMAAVCWMVYFLMR